MKAKAVVGCAVLSALAITAPQAVASEAVPLTARDGVVVSWQSRSKSAVVVMTNQKVLVIHALRRYRVGRWVRVHRIRWGRAVAGVKWGYRPWGIKWAITMARNGTYRAALTDLGSVKHTMVLRAVVLTRNKRRMVVSVPGASWSIRFGRRAVWLPSAKLVNAPSPNGFGMTVAMRLKIDNRGRVVITRAKRTQSRRLGAIIPVAGTVVRRNFVRRQRSVLVGGPSGVTVTVTVPPGVNMGVYPVGSEVSGTVVTPPLSLPPILTGLSRNDNFGTADRPGSTVGAVVPPGSDGAIPGNSTSSPGGTGEVPLVPSTSPTPPPIGTPSTDDKATQSQIDAITAIRESWDDAGTGDPRRVSNADVYEGQAQLLLLVNNSIIARQRSLAVLQLVAFELVVGAQTAAAVDPTYKSQIIARTTALRISLLETL